MGKQNKRKSQEGVAAASPNKGAVTPKKVKIQAESPVQSKNKPMKTPIKHKAPKSPTGNVTPKKQKNAAKKAATNGAAKVKKSPKPKLTLLPEDLSKKLNRRQKKRIVHKIAQAMKHKGKEDLTNINTNDASIKEIFEKIIKKDTTGAQGNKSDKTKAKVLKQVNAEDEAEGDDSQEKETTVKTPKKKPVPKKTPKKSPKAN